MTPPAKAKNSPGRFPVAGLILVVSLALLAAYGLRYGWIEPAAYGHRCAEPGAPWWCAPRQALIAAVWLNALGALSVVTALWALVTSGRNSTLTAVATGAAGLVLYNYDWSAAGFLCGLLVFARQRQPGTGEQH
jgi:hypothetical protein